MTGAFDDETDEREPTRRLDKEECWQRIVASPFGRIATTAAGEVDIFPVNHGVDGETIVFRTAPGSKLLEIMVHSHVAFEVDGYSDSEAWSVVAKGDAEEFTSEHEIESAERLGVRPWAPEHKDRWVRITVTEVHGRSFRR
ncbi:pyridoxamine 5'-phosphate oxidase family protein [Agromyces intestinalis]|uniref:Pyridoxamine 5'-phosphate oxidase family protein n=1 Tax=Agromyces intestinalis TaxID=2592652 RepID=A0A5C1YCG6_9MICO|nr:pyridoxamine 5'-phosphate oxidase family protein [Agromyces intestinalis]QEO13783.1 pyridoxamine 5'-phosphate oxidase family protein [Agromyces intestinalis]